MRLKPSGEMNVTPLIDVLLVLLVIFIAALPLSQQGLEAQLPAEARPASPMVPETSQIVAEYSADHVLRINRSEVSMRDAGEVLREIYATRRDKTMFVIGDGALRYGDITSLIDVATGAGVDRIGIITDGLRARR